MQKFICLSIVICTSLTACNNDSENPNQQKNDNPPVIRPSQHTKTNDSLSEREIYKYKNSKEWERKYRELFEARKEQKLREETREQEEQKCREEACKTQEQKEQEREEKIKNFISKLSQNFKTINASNLEKFVEEIYDFRKELLWQIQFDPIKEEVIKDGHFYGKYLGISMDIDFTQKGNSLRDNVSLFNNLRFLGTKLEFPLTPATFPKPNEQQGFFYNLRKLGPRLEYPALVKPNHQFSVKNGRVNLNGENYFEINSIKDFADFINGLYGDREFFDDSVFKNVFTLSSNGRVKIYGGKKEFDIFSGNDIFCDFCYSLDGIRYQVEKKPEISFEKISLKQDNGSILLNDRITVPERLWKTADFWETIRVYKSSLDITPIKIEQNGKDLNSIKIGHIVIDGFHGDVFDPNGDINKLWRKIFTK